MKNPGDFRIPELLAPVGGWPHLTAAINNGADAVYMGGLLYNARAFADNFTEDDLPKAIDYAHAHNVKVYITLNTLLEDRELVRAFEYANYLYEIGADALIVQDMGLVRLLRKHLPDLPLHLSTQGTVYNKYAVPMLKDIGFTRVVPARELSIGEIGDLAEACHAEDIEVEVFVHGALCMCYSGQCQMSRVLGGGSGRSGNRGTCAQPCRQLYTDENGQTTYALSPKDICTIECIPDLIASGADSFKIEGRIKTPEYVAIVTRMYRKYIDKSAELLRSNGGDFAVAKAAYEVNPQDMMYLKQAFNRGGFTTGYLYGNPGEDILSGTSPKNQGLHAGQVLAVLDSEDKVDNIDDRRAVRGALKRGRTLACVHINGKQGKSAVTLDMGDGVEFRDEEFEAKPVGNVITYLRSLGDGDYVIGDFERGYGPGDAVYKVTDKQLLTEAMDTPEKKLPVTILFTARIGQYISLVMTDVKAGYTYEITGDHIIEAAVKAPTAEDRILDNLCRLGDTPYTADVNSCDIELDEGAMVPLSLINRLRRDAADHLLENRLNAVKQGREPLTRAKLDVIESGEQLGKTAGGPTVMPGATPIPLEEFMQDDFAAEGTLPYILNVSKGRLDAFIEENFDAIVEKLKAAADGCILIGNLGWIKQFQNAGITVYADYGLNIYNEQAAGFFRDYGLKIFAWSHETGKSDGRGIPMMITEHPLPMRDLADRKGAHHRTEAAPSGDKWLIY